MTDIVKLKDMRLYICEWYYHVYEKAMLANNRMILILLLWLLWVVNSINENDKKYALQCYVLWYWKVEL